MKLVKYHRPFEAFDSLFNSLNRGLFPAVSHSCAADESNEPAMRLPRTNIEEKDDSYVITLEMPGLSKKDIEVSVENDKLSVKGQRVEKSSDEGEKGFLRREIRSSSYERGFVLGNEVDQDNIKAKMDDGVLTVTVAKKHDKVGRKVDVD
jgi:HSP20 family protein